MNVAYLYRARGEKAVLADEFKVLLAWHSGSTLVCNTSGTAVCAHALDVCAVLVLHVDEPAICIILS